MSVHEQVLVPSQDVPAATLGVAVSFGACAGMYHPGSAEEGILILPPFGHESLACAKTLRLLAEQLSRQGYPVLRLDFPGTGDAPGEESEHEMISSRRSALIDAALWMRNLARVNDVSLIGVRLGATIGLLSVREIAPKRVLLASPVLNGKAYLRELQQMRALYAVNAQEGTDFAANEFNGFSLSAESVDALRKLDLRRENLRAGVETAIIGPQGAGVVAALVETWRAAGHKASVIDYCEMDVLLADPAKTPPEGKFIALAADWFGEADTRDATQWMPQQASLTHGPDWTERACRFGRGNNFGVLCEPKVADPHAPALVIVNTGGNSHIGWGRQTVELARRLAGDGVTTLRIDIGGVGETPDAQDRIARVVYCSDSAADAISAVEFMKAQGYRRPAVAGICSGAFLVFHALRHSPDISGALMVNLQKFHWKDGDELVLYNSIGSYAARLINKDALRRLLRGESDLRGILSTVLNRLGAMARARLASLLPQGKSARSGEAEIPSSPRDVIASALQDGQAVMMAYTEGDGGVDEMRSHLGGGGRSVRHRGDFAFEMIAGADHNFSNLASRKKLYPLVLHFVNGIADRRAVSQTDKGRQQVSGASAFDAMNYASPVSTQAV